MNAVVFHKETLYNLDHCERVYVKGKDVVIVYPDNGTSPNKQHLSFDTSEEAQEFFDILWHGAVGFTEDGEDVCASGGCSGHCNA